MKTSTDDRLLSNIPTNQHAHTKHKGVKHSCQSLKQKPNPAIELSWSTKYQILSNIEQTGCESLMNISDRLA